MQLDYYKILGISRDATSEQVRQAYRSKAKMYHPDINKTPNAKVLFQLINEAYQVLVNPEKKRWYDFKLKYPSTTGLKQQQERKRSSTYDSYYKAYTQHQQQKKEEQESAKYRKTLLDNFLFYFLIASGILAIIYSTIDLIYDEFNLKNMSGAIFGIWFITLMFWGWSLISKK